MGKDKASKRSRGSLVQDIVHSDAVKRKNRPAKERSRQSDNVDKVGMGEGGCTGALRKQLPEIFSS